MKDGREIYRHAERRIPGGTQLLSKRPQRLLPDQWPSYYTKAKGIDVWDTTGRRFQDFSFMGLGACTLGYADDDVDGAVRACIDAGNMTTLNCPEEVELAEVLVRLHPWAGMVRYARTGGEAMAIAVRIARAATGKDVVAFCGYHGWNDWYLAANLGDASALDGHLLPGLPPSGVPRALKGTALPFHYNRLEELEAIVASHRDDLGAIVMEPVRSKAPTPGFLEGVRRIADELGVPLVFDEVSSGFRGVLGGAHLEMGVRPDIAVFAKSIGNGYPMAAVIGRDHVMRAAASSFISSTYWSERIGPTAALATIAKFESAGAPARIQRAGRRVTAGWRAIAHDLGLDLHTDGMDAMPHFVVRHAEAEAAHTLFTQEMLYRGYLATNSFYASLAHTDEGIDAYLAAARDALGFVQTCLRAGDVRSALKGPVREAGFARLT